MVIFGKIITMKIVALQIETELGYDDVLETIISTYPDEISLFGYNSMVLENRKDKVTTEIYSSSMEEAQANSVFVKQKLDEIEIEYTIDFRELEDSHYLYAYKEFLKPMQVGAITIVPNTRESFQASLDEVSSVDDTNKIYIAKQYAFGTGVHETTSLAMEFVHEYSSQTADFSSKHIIDVGCGSGILSLLCHRLGATNITSIDIDIAAVNCTIDNAQYNNIKLGNVLEAEARHFADKNEHFDFIIANIETDILVLILDDLVSIAKTGSKIMLSGILLEKFDDMAAKISEHSNLKIISQKSKNDWTALMLEIL